jgi:hypothetical protein
VLFSAPAPAAFRTSTSLEQEPLTVSITFRRSFRVFTGVRLNIQGKCWSVTVGPKNGPKRTWYSTGQCTTSVDLPAPFDYRRTARACVMS